MAYAHCGTMHRCEGCGMHRWVPCGLKSADSEGRLFSLQKSDLRDFTVSTKSNMPSYKGELTTDELSDLVAYLLTLKGQ